VRLGFGICPSLLVVITAYKVQEMKDME